MKKPAVLDTGSLAAEKTARVFPPRAVSQLAA